MASRLRISLAQIGVFPPPSPPTMHLPTSALGFAIWWLTLLLLHIINVAYYVGAAILYRSMRFSNVDFQLTTYSIGISSEQWYKVSTIHWIIGGIHMLLVVSMVVGSLQARRLAFQPKNVTRWITWLYATGRGRNAVKEKADSFPSSISTSLATFTGYSARVTSSVFGRKGFLGVDGVYFDHLHLLRELIETTLQTIQVYRMSYLLPRVWFIRVYVTLLIANCWSTPMIHRYYANRHVHRRVMSLLCDAVLDMMSSIGVSLWIIATYVPQYTDPAFGFPFDIWFDDVWFTNMQQEFQMMMVVSWADMASRLVFAVGLLQCTNSIKKVLAPIDTRVGMDRTENTASPVVNSDTTKAIRADTSLTALGPIDRIVQPTIITSGRRWSRLVKFVLEKAGPGFFLALGCAILVVHVVSETRATSGELPCRLIVHPWFVNKPACSLFELDCNQLGRISGSKDSMKAAWNTFEAGATARIFVRHCPQLEIPPAISQFHQITAVKLYNCSLAEWSPAAAITEASHTYMRALFMVRTKFANGELPPGLVTTQSPSGLKSFVTSATNLAKLPENLHDVWPAGMALSFELSQLQAVPPTILKTNAAVLSFAGSPIATVPAELFTIPALNCMLLSYTMIQELPRVVTNPSPWLYLMFLEGTNVSAFWSWMEPLVQVSYATNSGFFNAHGSRYCAERAEIAAQNRTTFSISTVEPTAADLASVMDVSTPAKLRFAWNAVVCEPGHPFYYPLGLQDASTALIS